jgi:hypothetical protein
MRIAAIGLVFAAVAAPASAADSALMCAKLLTADEVKAAVGPGFQDMGPDKRKEGETGCSWMKRGEGEFKTVHLSFYEPAAMEGSADAFFETLVKAAEEVGSSKRELLKGIGLRAARVPYGEQMRVLVQTTGGVGLIAAFGVTKEQAIAVARAVANP